MIHDRIASVRLGVLRGAHSRFRSSRLAVCPYGHGSKRPGLVTISLKARATGPFWLSDMTAATKHDTNLITANTVRGYYTRADKDQDAADALHTAREAFDIIDDVLNDGLDRTQCVEMLAGFIYQHSKEQYYENRKNDARMIKALKIRESEGAEAEIRRRLDRAIVELNKIK